MKDTKVKKAFRIFKASKFLDEAYKVDQNNIIAKYNEKGHRDAKIVSDSIWFDEEGNLAIKIKLKEGNPYYFGDITFVGNTKYSNQELNQMELTRPRVGRCCRWRRTRSRHHSARSCSSAQGPRAPPGSASRLSPSG